VECSFTAVIKYLPPDLISISDRLEAIGGQHEKHMESMKRSNEKNKEMVIPWARKRMEETDKTGSLWNVYQSHRDHERHSSRDWNVI
jgi:hypothetical protein